MKRKWCFLIIIMCMVLVGCNKNTEAKTTENEENMEEDPDNDAGKKDVPELQVEEVREIIRSTIIEVDETTARLGEKNIEWYNLSSENADGPPYTKEFNEGVAVLQDELTPVMTKQALDEFGASILIIKYCECDAYNWWRVEDTKVRLTIEEQSEDAFIATSIRIGDDMVDKGWTNKWYFKKEKDTWKLDDFESIDTGVQPLHLTFDDLKESFHDNETGEANDISFIDEVDLNGESFMVIEHGSGFREAYNTASGAKNYEVASNYMEEDGDSSVHEDSSIREDSNQPTLSRRKNTSDTTDTDETETTDEVSMETEITRLTQDYVYSLVDAINDGDYGIVEHTIKSGSLLEEMQMGLVERLYDIETKQEVINVTVDRVDISDAVWQVNTSETILIMYANGEEELNEYNWHYTVEQNADGSFVLSNIQ